LPTVHPPLYRRTLPLHREYYLGNDAKLPNLQVTKHAEIATSLAFCNISAVLAFNQDEKLHFSVAFRDCQTPSHRVGNTTAPAHLCNSSRISQNNGTRASSSANLCKAGGWTPKVLILWDNDACDV